MGERECPPCRPISQQPSRRRSHAIFWVLINSFSAAENHLSLQNFLIGEFLELLEAAAAALPIFGPRAPPPLFEAPAHALEVGFNGLLGIFDGFFIGRGDVHREPYRDIAGLARMAGLPPRLVV